MLRKPRRTTIPSVVERFARYYKNNPAWGDLHIVLADHNVEDDSVEWCRSYIKRSLGSSLTFEEARAKSDALVLCYILVKLSRTQRLKLPSSVDRHLRLAQEPGVFKWRHHPPKRFAENEFLRPGLIRLVCQTCRVGAKTRYSPEHVFLAQDTALRVFARLAEHVIFHLKNKGCPHVGERGECVPEPEWLKGVVEQWPATSS